MAWNPYTFYTVNPAILTVTTLVAEHDATAGTLPTLSNYPPVLTFPLGGTKLTIRTLPLYFLRLAFWVQLPPQISPSRFLVRAAFRF